MMKATASGKRNPYNDRHRDEFSSRPSAAPLILIASYIIAQYSIETHHSELVSIEILR
jgi:hypothetical protein